LHTTETLKQIPIEFSELKWFSRSARRDWEHIKEIYIGELCFLQENVIPRISKTSSIVDYGCLTGWLPMVLAPYCHRLTVYASSNQGLLLSQQDVVANGLFNIAFGVTSFKSPLPRGTYDMAMCMGLLRYRPDDSDCLSFIGEMVDHIKPGGYFLLKDMMALPGESDEPIREQGNARVRFRSVQRLHELVESNGLTLVSRETLGKSTAMNTPYISVISLYQKPL
jgi:SAM-dependent methyltransferase